MNCKPVASFNDCIIGLTSVGLSLLSAFCLSLASALDNFLLSTVVSFSLLEVQIDFQLSAESSKRGDHITPNVPVLTNDSSPFH